MKLKNTSLALFEGYKLRDVLQNQNSGINCCLLGSYHSLFQEWLEKDDLKIHLFESAILTALFFTTHYE